MRIPVLIAGDGAGWEAGLVLAFEDSDHGVTVVRRCVDVVEVLAVAASGQARVALLAAGLPRLDGDAIDRLTAAGVAAVGVVGRDAPEVQAQLQAIGVSFFVPPDADPKVIAAVVEDAVTALRPSADVDGMGGDAGSAGSADDADDAGGRRLSARSFSLPVGSSVRTPADSEIDSPGPPGEVSGSIRRGSVIAVWGPTGAPGRTTVAVTVADELSRLGSSSLLIDADVYGGVVAAALGLLDESAGLAAACRLASSTRLDAPTLAASCFQVTPALRVLTGIPRAERWPELRPAGLASVLSAARGVADFVVVDCGFCLESDEELSFDSLAPRRNGATLAILDAADLVLIVGATDPLGLQRLARGLAELRDAEVAATSWVVLNKVRRAVVPGDPGAELREALLHFTGRVPAALLPFDPDGVDAALAGGKTLAEARPSSALRRAFVELAAAIAGVPAPTPRRHRRTG